jgi:hypothetical protein
MAEDRALRLEAVDRIAGKIGVELKEIIYQADY